MNMIKISDKSKQLVNKKHPFGYYFKKSENFTVKIKKFVIYSIL